MNDSTYSNHKLRAISKKYFPKNPIKNLQLDHEVDIIFIPTKTPRLSICKQQSIFIYDKIQSSQASSLLCLN